ncbi:DUF4367 domain-containing protein [Roseburia hominis]
MKDRQDNLEKLLEEELKKEADQILAELEADESLKHIELPDDLDARMMERMRKIEEEKEVYAKLSEKDREALRLGKDMQVLRELEEMDKDEVVSEVGESADHDGKMDDATEAEDTTGKRVVFFRKKRRMAYVMVAIVAVMVMAMGVTSFGETPMYTKVGKLNVGSREIVQIDSAREGENNLVGEDEESGAYDAIEEAFGVDVVRMQYLPDKTTFLNSDLDMTLKRVCLLYQSQDSIIEYKIMLNYLEQSAGYDVEDTLVEEKELKVLNVPIKIKRYLLLENQTYQMVAEFKYKNVYYILNAPINETEFLKIIENLNFF